jgi:hypothetical protein
VISLSSTHCIWHYDGLLKIPTVFSFLESCLTHIVRFQIRDTKNAISSFYFLFSGFNQVDVAWPLSGSVRGLRRVGLGFVAPPDVARHPRRRRSRFSRRLRRDFHCMEKVSFTLHLKCLPLATHRFTVVEVGCPLGCKRRKRLPVSLRKNSSPFQRYTVVEVEGPCFKILGSNYLDLWRKNSNGVWGVSLFYCFRYLILNKVFKSFPHLCSYLLQDTVITSIDLLRNIFMVFSCLKQNSNLGKVS